MAHTITRNSFPRCEDRDCTAHAIVRIRDWSRGVQDTWGRDVCAKHLHEREHDDDPWAHEPQIIHRYRQDA